MQIYILGCYIWLVQYSALMLVSALTDRLWITDFHILFYCNPTSTLRIFSTDPTEVLWMFTRLLIVLNHISLGVKG